MYQIRRKAKSLKNKNERVFFVGKNIIRGEKIMSLTVYLEESNNFEYFICNLPENDEKKLCVTNKTVKNKAFKNADFIENIFF